MLKYLEKLQMEDIDNLQKKHETQQQLMAEVAKCNEEIQVQKTRMRELEKKEDIKVMEYLKKKEVSVEYPHIMFIHVLCIYILLVV